MPNKNYLRGRRLEWQVQKDLEKAGWHAVRTAGSHGAYDIIAFKYLSSGTLHLRCIQCKTAKGVTEASLKKLMLKLKEESPIKELIDSDSILVDVDLIVKVKGSSKYRTYSIEGPLNV